MSSESLSYVDEPMGLNRNESVPQADLATNKTLKPPNTRFIIKNPAPQNSKLLHYM